MHTHVCVERDAEEGNGEEEKTEEMKKWRTDLCLRLYRNVLIETVSSVTDLKEMTELTRGMHVKHILSTINNQDKDLIGLRSIRDAAVGVARSRAIEVKGCQCKDLCSSVMSTVGVPLKILGAPYGSCVL